MSEDFAGGDFLVSSRKAAKMIGVSVSTLRRWRALGLGPTGWVRRKRNLVMYPHASIRCHILNNGRGA